MTDHVVALLFVRLYKGKKSMDVAIDDNGTKRLVRFKWQAKGDSDVPPENWFKTAIEELRFVDADRKRGMIGGY